MKKRMFVMVSIGIGLFLGGCSTTKVVLSDDFSPSATNLRNLWQSNGKGTWMVQGPISSAPGCQDGCLSQNSEDPRALNAIDYVSAPTLADGQIETVVRTSYDLSVAETQERLNNLKSFTGAGLVFRMVDLNNFYMFRLAGEEGVVLGKMVNGTWTDIGNPRRVDFLDGGKLRPKTWYKLKVETNGDRIQAFINDNPVINTTDSSFSVGKFGVTTFKTAADFEYLKATEK